MRKLQTLTAAAALVLAVGFGSPGQAGDLSPDDTALSTEFSKQFGPATLVAIVDVAGPAVTMEFTGLTGTGTGVGDNFPVGAATGCEADAGGAFGDCSGFQGIAYLITNLSGTESVNVASFMNTGFTDTTPGGVDHEVWCGSAACDTFFQGPWTSLGPGETKVIKIDFSTPDQAFNTGDDPDFTVDELEDEVRRLNQTSHIGIQVADFSGGPTDVTLLIGPVPIMKEITSGPPDGVFTKVKDGIENGSFEDPVCGGDFCTLAGPGGLTGWTIGDGGIDLIDNLWLAQDLEQSLDMSAENNGSISQTLTTEVDRSYEVRFWMSGNSANVPGSPTDCDTTTDTKNKRLNVSVDNGGGTNTDYVYDVVAEGNSNGDMKWRAEVFSFTADDTSTVLTFDDNTTPTTTNCGVALDNVMLFREGIAVAVEAPQTATLHYDFKITVDTTGLTDPVVIDTVPAEWDVAKINGVEVPDGYLDRAGLQAFGLACGESATVEGVDLSRGGKLNKTCHSDTDLIWDLDPDVMDMIRVDLQSRLKNKPKKFYSPTGCGALELNAGAVLLDGIDVVAGTGPLVVAAMSDLDGGGIDPTGHGDEDGDGIDDIDEVRVSLTDPCNPDTDGDGLSDGAEVNTHGTDPNNPDTDGGGENDGSEVNNARDPLNPADDVP